ncbi:MAG: hypothetical protein ABEJ07_02720 [Candidatus Nanohaloarchaea archaeon]
MMEDEEYEDYLVDKAKEILNEEITETDGEGVEAPDIEDKPGTTGEKPAGLEKRNHLDEKAEKDSTSKIPYSWDPQEVEFLTRNRERMSNEELKEFMERDSEFQEKMDELDEWNGFSRWEERLMVQQHSMKTSEEIAEELDRDQREVELKMHMMGLLSDQG